MNKRTQIASGFRSGAVVSMSLACLLAATQAFAAGSVKAPPLPPGSAIVKIKVGQNPEEEQRGERAHKHKVGKVDPNGEKQGSKS
ncbi:MAG: hypothetical protein NVS3B2_04030 [Ramlibacter sp.]